MTERAVVQTAEGRMATLAIEGSEACTTCCARTACTMGADGSRVIEAFNPIGARAGDTVRISIGSGVVLLAAFVVFIVPIFGILIGYAVGVSVGGSQHAGVVGALVGLIASFLVARWWDRRMLRSKRHVPTIIEIVSRAEEVGSGMGAG